MEYLEMKNIIFGLMIFTLSACASGGLVGQLPKVEGPSAEINVIRESAYTGSGINYNFLFDNFGDNNCKRAKSSACLKGLPIFN